MSEPCLYCGTDVEVDEYFFEHEGALGWGFLCSACVVGVHVAVECSLEEIQAIEEI